MEFKIDALENEPTAVLYIFDNLSTRHSNKVQYTLKVQFLILDNKPSDIDFFDILKKKGESRLISLPVSNLGQFDIGDVFENGVLKGNCMPNKPVNKRKVLNVNLSDGDIWELGEYLFTSFSFTKNKMVIDESLLKSKVLVFKDKFKTEFVIPLCVVMKHFYMFNSYITRIYFQTGIETEKGIYSIINKSLIEKSLTFKLDRKLDNGWASVVARSILMSGLRQEFTEFFKDYNSQLVNDSRLIIPFNIKWPENEGTSELSFRGIRKKIEDKFYFFVFSIDQTIGDFELGEYEINLINEVRAPSEKEKDPNKPDRIVKVGNPEDEDVTIVNEDFNQDIVPLDTDTPNAINVSGFPPINIEYVVKEKDPGGTTVIIEEPTHLGTGQEDKDSDGMGTVENLEEEPPEDEETDGSINFHYLFEKVAEKLNLEYKVELIKKKLVFSEQFSTDNFEAWANFSEEALKLNDEQKRFCFKPNLANRSLKHKLRKRKLCIIHIHTPGGSVYLIDIEPNRSEKISYFLLKNSDLDDVNQFLLKFCKNKKVSDDDKRFIGKMSRHRHPDMEKYKNLDRKQQIEEYAISLSGKILRSLKKISC